VGAAVSLPPPPQAASNAAAKAETDNAIPPLPLEQCMFGVLRVWPPGRSGAAAC
jgi:hypothetical protein